jgi:hypothetical protein
MSGGCPGTSDARRTFTFVATGRLLTSEYARPEPTPTGLLLWFCGRLRSCRGDGRCAVGNGGGSGRRAPDDRGLNRGWRANLASALSACGKDIRYPVSVLAVLGRLGPRHEVFGIDGRPIARTAVIIEGHDAAARLGCELTGQTTDSGARHACRRGEPLVLAAAMKRPQSGTARSPA